MKIIRLVSAIAVLSVIGAASADTIWVSKTGDDAYEGDDIGSEEHPFATIQAGVDKARSGDTVKVLEGEYATGETFAGSCTNRVAIINKKIHLVAPDGAAKTTIVGKWSSTDPTGATKTNTDNIRCVYVEANNKSQHGTVIEGFTFRDGAAFVDYGGGVASKGNISTYVVDCVFTNCTSCGVFDGKGPSLPVADYVFVVRSRFSDCKGWAMVRYGKAFACLFDNCRYYRGVFGYSDSVNCTIVGNSSTTKGGGIHISSSNVGDNDGSIVNTIVANNVSKLDADTADVYAPSAPSTTFDHCSAANLANVTAFPAGMGEGCTIIAPVFDSERPHRLKSASAPQIDSGVTLDWMTDDAVDLDGLPRVRFDGVDMGCFELQEKQVIPLGGSVSVTQSTGRYPFETTFVPALVGDQKGVEGTWSFGDGASVAYSGESVSHVYERPGQYAVTLSIANEAGETAELAVSTAIIVVGETCRVSANGTSVAPYLTWETAATNLQDAVALRPDTVLVTNGTFTLRDSGMVLDRPVVVKSVNGPAVTTIDGEGQHRIATISDDGVLLEGFTLMRGHCTDWQGQFVNMTCGELRNCILTNATKGLDRDRFIVASGTARLTDLRMWFGTEVGSGNGDNSCLWGVLLSGQATADRCLFDHWQLKRNHVNAQAALSVSGKAAVRNSLIRDCLYAAKNWQDNAENACIVDLSGGGTLENCTMVHCEVQPKSSNTKQRLPVYLGTSGKVINCVFSGNRDEFGTEHDFAGSTDGVSFSRSVDLVAGVRGNVSADPCFKNAVRGNFRPRASSPIIDAGTNLVWTAAADAVDLDGCRRCVNKTVDMGCYEHQWSGFTLIVK